MNVLDQIQQAGFQIELANDDTLKISPGSKLTTEDCKFIREHKPELIQLLRDEQHIRDWLTHISETDEAIIEETLNRCSEDKETRAYFLQRWRLALH